MHLLPKELKLAKLTELALRDPPEFSAVQVLPDERKAMADTLQLQQKEEKGVILDQALLADDTVKRVLRGIL